MLNSFFVIPGYTFFYWGFTLPGRNAREFARHYGFRKGQQLKDIELVIDKKKYPAKLRLVRIRTKKFPARDVVQIYYNTKYETLKALRKLFIYSYAATINKTRPAIKELFELQHASKDVFIVKPFARQKTEFEGMLRFLEDKNIFDYWKKARKGKEPNSFFIDYSRKWLSVKELRANENRINVIYVLFHSKKKQLYVGKANRLGDRVKAGVGRIGLDADWDKFIYFEIDPEFSPFIEQIEAFTIRALSSLMPNDVGVQPLAERNARLVNRQLKKH